MKLEIEEYTDGDPNDPTVILLGPDSKCYHKPVWIKVNPRYRNWCSGDYGLATKCGRHHAVYDLGRANLSQVKHRLRPCKRCYPQDGEG